MKQILFATLVCSTLCYGMEPAHSQDEVTNFFRTSQELLDEAEQLADKLQATALELTSPYEVAQQFLAQDSKQLKKIHPGGNTVLHCAVTEALNRPDQLNASLVTITALLERGLDPRAKNDEGNTPIDLAKECPILQKLLSAQRPNKKFLLLLAMEHGNEELVANLIK